MARIAEGSHHVSSILPAASAEETAAIVAALELFMHETAPAPPPPPSVTPDPWRRAALLEGVSRGSRQERLEPWINV
jgi:hypothetical protein